MNNPTRPGLKLHKIVVLSILTVVALVSLFFIPEKQNPGLRVDFEQYLPSTVGDWTLQLIPQQETASQPVFINELLEVFIEHPQKGKLYLTLEFGADPGKMFQLHLPHVCHRVRGDETILFEPITMVFPDGREFQTALLQWYYPKNSVGALCAFWAVIDDQAMASYFRLALSQFFAGLFYANQNTVLVRLDTHFQEKPTLEQRETLQITITSFLKDLYQALDAKGRNLIFGEK